MSTKSNLTTYTIRLTPGQDIKPSLAAFCDENKLRAPFVLTCVGSVSKATLRMAKPNSPMGESVMTFNKNFEIVSLVGTLGGAGHLHISLSDEFGNVIGGHLMDDVMDTSQSGPTASGDDMLGDQSKTAMSDDVTVADESETVDSHVECDLSANAMETNAIESTDVAFASKCKIDLSAPDKVLGKSCSQEEICSKIDQMIERLSVSDAHFKHQQRNEPDLTTEQKSEIARTMFTEHPVKFLSQFSKYLQSSDSACFNHIADDPTVRTYLEELEKSSKASNKRRIMNRRFQAMKAKTEEGSYFSEETMKHRDPLLYQQMIGQYLSAEERKPPEIDRSDHRFSTILMEFMERCDDVELMRDQKEKEEEQEEETDSEDEEENEDEDAMDSAPSTSSGPAPVPFPPPPTPAISDEEKNILKEEFLRIMQERFMSGQDSEFDYRTVDDNEEYDPLDIRAQDEEERYFDDMDPETVSDDEVTLDSDSDCWTRPSGTQGEDT